MEKREEKKCKEDNNKTRKQKCSQKLFKWFSLYITDGCIGLCVFQMFRLFENGIAKSVAGSLVNKLNTTITHKHSSQSNPEKLTKNNKYLYWLIEDTDFNPDIFVDQ